MNILPLNVPIDSSLKVHLKSPSLYFTSLPLYFTIIPKSLSFEKPKLTSSFLNVILSGIAIVIVVLPTTFPPLIKLTLTSPVVPLEVNTPSEFISPYLLSSNAQLISSGSLACPPAESTPFAENGIFDFGV